MPPLRSILFLPVGGTPLGLVTTSSWACPPNESRIVEPAPEWKLAHVSRIMDKRYRRELCARDKARWI
jgi:hypothetical protein